MSNITLDEWGPDCRCAMAKEVHLGRSIAR